MAFDHRPWITGNHLKLRVVGGTCTLLCCRRTGIDDPPAIDFMRSTPPPVVGPAEFTAKLG
jgi:hypothetical protein